MNRKKKHTTMRNRILGLVLISGIVTIGWVLGQSGKAETTAPRANPTMNGKRAANAGSGHAATERAASNVSKSANVPTRQTDSSIGVSVKPTNSSINVPTQQTVSNTVTNPNVSVQQPIGNTNVPTQQTTATPVANQPRRVTMANRTRYTVQPGDSLYNLAVRFGVTVAGIRQSNGLNATQLEVGQIIYIPGRHSVKPNPVVTQKATLAQIYQAKGIQGTAEMRIFVDKSAKTLSVFAGNVWLKNYHIELGDNGTGDKWVSGDHKTPEGTFYVSEISVLQPADEYLGSRWMRLSYPNVEDAQRGLNRGLIDAVTFKQIVTANRDHTTPPQRTALGGGVGIHGGTTTAKGSNWTWGCVGLSNQDVEEIFPYVTVGTPVIIQS